MSEGVVDFDRTLGDVQRIVDSVCPYESFIRIEVVLKTQTVSKFSFHSS